ncbi:hypothetical protein DFH29DRAFT_876339 [Suillus ampliporus]|nr:hypothetical protein DFH29DRAFT_876339 [Suillus ampliporus]
MQVSSSGFRRKIHVAGGHGGSRETSVGDVVSVWDVFDDSELFITTQNDAIDDDDDTIDDKNNTMHDENDVMHDKNDAFNTSSLEISELITFPIIAAHRVTRHTVLAGAAPSLYACKACKQAQHLCSPYSCLFWHIRHNNTYSGYPIHTAPSSNYDPNDTPGPNLRACTICKTLSKGIAAHQWESHAKGTALVERLLNLTSSSDGSDGNSESQEGGLKHLFVFQFQKDLKELLHKADELSSNIVLILSTCIEVRSYRTKFHRGKPPGEEILFPSQST